MNDSFHPRRIFSYLIIAAIALVFVLQFGPGGKGCEVRQSSLANAATVNGKSIPTDQLAQSYRQQLMMMQSRLGGQAQGMDPDLLRQFVKPDQVLERLVDRELLVQAADRNGVVASDAEVLKILRERADFQKNGAFDEARYTDVVKQYYRKTPVAFEEELRHELSMQKLIGVVQASAVVSDEELKARFVRENDKAQLQFVRFQPTMFAGEVKAPTSSELDAYIPAHEAQIAKQYETNHFAYQLPEQVRVRRLLLKVAPTATPDEKAQAKAKAEALKIAIDGGKSFESVAKESSEDEATRATGGDLGFRSRDESGWAPTFARAAFSLPPGKVSSVLETPEGIQLLQVVEKKPGVEKPLAEVKRQIAEQQLRREQAQSLAKAAAEDAMKKVIAGKKLSDLFAAEKPAGLAFAAQTKPELADTGSFSLAEASIPKLGVAPPLFQAIREKASPGLLPRLFAVSDSFVIAELTQRTQPKDSEFANQKITLSAEALQAKRMELQDSYVKALRKGAKVTTNADVLASLSGNGG